MNLKFNELIENRTFFSLIIDKRLESEGFTKSIINRGKVNKLAYSNSYKVLDFYDVDHLNIEISNANITITVFDMTNTQSLEREFEFNSKRVGVWEDLVSVINEKLSLIKSELIKKYPGYYDTDMYTIS